MAKPCGVRLSGEARKQVMGDREAKKGPGSPPGWKPGWVLQGTKAVPENSPNLSLVLSLLPGHSQIPALLASLCTEPELPGKSGLW